MKTHPGIHWFWFLTLLLAVPAPAAETARQIYRQALVQENSADDPAAALALYEQAARAAPAGAALAQAARWRAAMGTAGLRFRPRCSSGHHVQATFD